MRARSRSRSPPVRRSDRNTLKQSIPIRCRAATDKRSMASAAARWSSPRCTCTRTSRSFYNGKQIQVPQYIGFAPNPAGPCLYWIHTHDASGVIHIEAPDLSPPQGGPYTLGMLFDIWGQPLQPDDIAGLKGTVTAYVNGLKYDGDLTNDSIARASADRARGGNAARPAAELHLPGRHLGT